MFCKIENGFYSLVGFHCEYLRIRKLKNFVFHIKRHVWADTVLKSGCGHSENLRSVTEICVTEDRKWFLLTSLIANIFVVTQNLNLLNLLISISNCGEWCHVQNYVLTCDSPSSLCKILCVCVFVCTTVK